MNPPMLIESMLDEARHEFQAGAYGVELTLVDGSGVVESIHDVNGRDRRFRSEVHLVSEAEAS